MSTAALEMPHHKTHNIGFHEHRQSTSPAAPVGEGSGESSRDKHRQVGIPHVFCLVMASEALGNPPAGGHRAHVEAEHPSVCTGVPGASGGGAKRVQKTTLVSLTKWKNHLSAALSFGEVRTTGGMTIAFNVGRQLRHEGGTTAQQMAAFLMPHVTVHQVVKNGSPGAFSCRRASLCMLLKHWLLKEHCRKPRETRRDRTRTNISRFV